MKLCKNKDNDNDMKQLLWCIIISFVIVFLLYRLWEFDFNVPLYYSDGDYLSTLAIIKRSINLKEFFISSKLGAPFNGSNIDYPYFGEIVNLLYFKLFVHIYGVFKGLNIAYFLLFPITSMISCLVMKQCNISNLWAILGSITYSFLPYRLLRNTSHLFLNCYFQIPIAILLCFWLIQDDKFLTANKNFFKYRRNIIGIISFLFIAYTGIYYAFLPYFLYVCL